MNEAVNVVFGDSFRYPLHAFNVNILEIEIPVVLSLARGTTATEEGTLWDSLFRLNCIPHQSAGRFPQLIVYSSDQTPVGNDESYGLIGATFL